MDAVRAAQRAVLLALDAQAARDMLADGVLAARVDAMRSALGDGFVYMALCAWSIDPLRRTLDPTRTPEAT